MSIIPGSSTTHVGFLNLVTEDRAGGISCERVDASDSASGRLSAEAEVVCNGVCASPNACTTSQNSSQEDFQPSSSARHETHDSTRTKRKLHRIAQVRLSQGVSERTLCRRLRIDVKQLRALEDPTSDIPLSMLLEIREALDVPFADLLEESDGLARPVLERAKLLKAMKTAVSLKECKLAPRPSRLVAMLNEQLIELMPELAEVGGWPEFGSRRGSDSIARILAAQIDTSNLDSE